MSLPPEASETATETGFGGGTRRGIAAGKVLAAGLFGLLLAIVLNSQQLLREAQQKPFGAGRDASIALWKPIETASSAVGLHLPRLWADQALGRTVADPGGGELTGPGPQTVDASGDVTGDETDSASGVAAQDGTAAVEGAQTGPETGPETGPSNVVVVVPRGESAEVPVVTVPTRAGTDEAATGEDASDATDDDSGDASTATQALTATPSDPLKLHILGDSMVQFFGSTMVGLADDTGVIDATSEHQLASGLSRPDFYDWPARITEVLAADDPDAVVLMFGGNDAQALLVDGEVAPRFSEPWNREYSGRVAHVMDLVTADPRRVLIWVGQPIMERPDYDSRMVQVNEIYAAEAAKRDRVHYVDTRDLFRGPNGGFSRYVADADGQLADVRLSDGVHLSTLGGRWLSELLLTELGTLVDLDSGNSS